MSESTKPKTPEQRESELQDEIYRLQSLIKMMARHIDGEFWTTTFTSREGRLHIYTYCSSDEPGSVEHAKAVAEILVRMGCQFSSPLRNTTTNEELDLE